MPKGRIHVTIPDSVKSFLEDARGVGSVTMTDTRFIVELEEDDDYNLGFAIAEFLNLVPTYGDYSLVVEKFERVD